MQVLILCFDLFSLYEDPEALVDFGTSLRVIELAREALRQLLQASKQHFRSNEFENMENK